MSLNLTKATGTDYFLTKELLVALLVLLVTLVLFILWKKSRATKSDVLLVGLCDSGKTALFSYLSFNKPIQSFMSQVENIAEYKSKKSLLRLVDIPGHERVFPKYWEMYKMNCKGVMFVIDSETVQTNICDVAELLYRILTDDTIQSNKVKIMIVCNKQDKLMAKGAEVIKTLLENELDTLKLTKMSQLESIDGKKNKSLLGRKKKHFDFSHCPMPVEFAEIISACQDVVLEPVVNWLEKMQ
ncbi:Small GTP-binding protein domain,P-loop containing nucleoside triphosphate hydrolase,Signal [Cinara cedri]|uniref:ADP-ribosylation factor-related protein 1 n=1 Tax=Cinara cedri TaxID=506608 RepID=A0A5E4MLE0_9HEMI|nr:Small GTP-binding protein domain,P-loop containing nucleoside triphosphate hydrolase,Signal [Cinara cedri]